MLRRKKSVILLHSALQAQSKLNRNYLIKNHLVLSQAQSVGLRARLQLLHQVVHSCRQGWAHLWHRGPVVSWQQRDLNLGTSALAGALTNWATSYSQLPQIKRDPSPLLAQTRPKKSTLDEAETNPKWPSIFSSTLHSISASSLIYYMFFKKLSPHKMSYQSRSRCMWRWS